MKQGNVVAGRQKEDSSIELTITDPIDGSTTKKRYMAIRGGISWPTARKPAYFCIVAQEYVAPDSFEDQLPTGTRTLLAEHEAESLSLHSFYRKVCDVADQMLCRSFCADLPDDMDECGFENDLDDYANECESSLYIEQGVTADNFFVLGLSRIRSAIDQGKLFVPDDSIVYSQLRSITRDDLAGSPEEAFHAITALAHVVGSYHRFAPRLTSHYKPPPPVDWRVV